ncbi:hypothetical protein D3C87_2066780 [compost metagenome]
MPFSVVDASRIEPLYTELAISCLVASVCSPMPRNGLNRFLASMSRNSVFFT